MSEPKLSCFVELINNRIALPLIGDSSHMKGKLDKNKNKNKNVKKKVLKIKPKKVPYLM